MMKYLKHLILMVLCLVCACPLSGCVMHYTARMQLSIVTTTFAGYDFAKNICGEAAQVKLLIAPGQDVHSYEPTPQDILDIKQADMFIYTGGENDVWVDRILDEEDRRNVNIIRMMDVVKLYKESDEGILVLEEEETQEEEWDEHVWTDPHNAYLICQKIKEVAKYTVECHMNSSTDAICPIIDAAANDYLTQLDALDRNFKHQLKEAKHHTIVFADRFPLRYFAEAYHLKYIAAYPGCAAECEPSAQTIASMIEYVKENQIPVVFKVEISNDNMLKTICEETGAKGITFYSCHTVSKEDYENGETYVTLMRRNLESLKEALS